MVEWAKNLKNKNHPKQGLVATRQQQKYYIVQYRIDRKTKWQLQEITLVSTLAISPVNLEDSGLYTCQSGFNSEANVTVIVISGKPQLCLNICSLQEIVSQVEPTIIVSRIFTREVSSMC